jgi:hypothetical protein
MRLFRISGTVTEVGVDEDTDYQVSAEIEADSIEDATDAFNQSLDMAGDMLEGINEQKRYDD